MTWVGRLLAQKRLIVSVAVMWSLAGVMAWQTMPRQEDPAMPNAWGMIIAPFPGADAATVERLVTDPIEEKLMEVAEIKVVSSVSRADAGIINIELIDAVVETQPVWDEVRRALEAIGPELPTEALAPRLDEHLNDQEAVVIALTGTDDLLLLKERAEALKRRLTALPSVSKIKTIADPGEQITIAVDDPALRRLGIDFATLAAGLREQNRLIPGGSVKVAGKEVSLRPGSEFADVEEIRNTPVLLPSGASVPLGAVAAVERTVASPAAERMWHNGQPAVGLGVIPKENLNRVAFGNSVREAVAAYREAIAPLDAAIMVDQPVQVDQRISQLTDALLLSIAVVALLLFFAMGTRLGLVVATVIPMVVFAGLFVFGLMGGALHQISIAALVISLGMLVDNAIVVTEGIQARLDSGQTPRAAAEATVRELFWPLAAATGTTVAAFVPMLLASGPTAEFTKSIPTVIILTLVASFLFAVTVTPLFARVLLRPKQGGVDPEQTGGAVAGLLGRVAVSRRKTVVAGAVAMVALSVIGAGFVSKRFFPTSDRALMIVSVTLPEGAHLDATSDAVARLTQALRDRPEVVSVTGFSGRTVPHFYYNLPNAPNSPQQGQLVVETRSIAALAPLGAWIKDRGQRQAPEADLVATPLEQGPPVIAPIEIRLFSSDLGTLERAAASVRDVVRGAPGTRDVRHSLGVGAPLIDFNVFESAAGRLGLHRRDVATALLRTTRGLSVGPLRSGEDPVPIRVRSTAGERTPVAALAGVDAAAPGQRSVPLAQVAVPTVRWMPAALTHRNRERMTRVTAHLSAGATFSETMAWVTPRLDALDLKAMGVRYELGGELEGSEEANGAMMAALPIGMILLLTILLAEFPSFRKVGIILMTVPLAAAGVIPGLLLAGQPFGFMSLLGVFALVGIVVNNAIVLIDRVDRSLEEGTPIAEAVRAAVRRRFRPILLTTATTIVGLLPLALSPTTLWPPLAFAMISGLAVSTLLTLLVVPALYLMLFRSPRPETIPAPALGGRKRASVSSG